MTDPIIGDVVLLDGKSEEIIDCVVISQKVYYALKGHDGVKSAVPSQSIEWNGQQFIVNPYKLNV